MWKVVEKKLLFRNQRIYKFLFQPTNTLNDDDKDNVII